MYVCVCMYVFSFPLPSLPFMVPFKPARGLGERCKYSGVCPSGEEYRTVGPMLARRIWSQK